MFERLSARFRFLAQVLHFITLRSSVRLELRQKDEMGQYCLKEKVQVGSLKMFLRIGHVILPRYLFYAVLLTTALAARGAGDYVWRKLPTLRSSIRVSGLQRNST